MSNIKHTVTETGELILFVSGWFCVCTSCGSQWFVSEKHLKEEPSVCTSCKVRHDRAERSKKDFEQKVKEGKFDIAADLYK